MGQITETTDGVRVVRLCGCGLCTIEAMWILIVDGEDAGAFCDGHMLDCSREIDREGLRDDFNARAQWSGVPCPCGSRLPGFEGKCPACFGKAQR